MVLKSRKEELPPGCPHLTFLWHLSRISSGLRAVQRLVTSPWETRTSDEFFITPLGEGKQSETWQNFPTQPGIRHKSKPNFRPPKIIDFPSQLQHFPLLLGNLCKNETRDLKNKNTQSDRLFWHRGCVWFQQGWGGNTTALQGSLSALSDWGANWGK